MYKVCNVFLLAISSFVVACSGNTIDPSLNELVNKYYAAQQNKDWSSTYDMRIPAFKKITEKKYYQDEMNKNDKGWKLNSFKIMESDTTAGRVVIKIKFDFTVSSDEESRDIQLFENTTWEKINGKWYCYNAGHQYHLPLNDSIVRD